MISKIFCAMAGNDTDGTIYKIEAIEYDGKLWLVPRWLEVPARGVSMPARIIRFDNQPHQRLPDGDYLLNGPIPKVLLGPTTPKQQVPGFEYVELPDIEILDSVRREQSVLNLKKPGHMHQASPSLRCLGLVFFFRLRFPSFMSA